MERVILGRTGLEVTRLGLGSGQLAGFEASDPELGRFLNGVLAMGINVIDTGHCYGTSEDYIGKHISHRRDEFVLITKCCSHNESDVTPWTAEVIRSCAEMSCSRMNTDHVDVLLLHGCPPDRMRNEAMLVEMEKVKQEGLTRFIGASGDNDGAMTAIELGIFDCLETSVSICDQQPIDTTLPMATEAQMGIIAKRTIAGACWRDLSNYAGYDYMKYTRPYAERLAKMGIMPETLGFDGDWAELALRFALFHSDAHIGLIGGRSLDHVRRNIAAAGRGALPEEVYNSIRAAWNANSDGSWIGQG
jgi:aryl-alcohol dehydrogenase-like predicted oxidoreductase